MSVSCMQAHINFSRNIFLAKNYFDCMAVLILVNVFALLNMANGFPIFTFFVQKRNQVHCSHHACGHAESGANHEIAKS